MSQIYIADQQGRQTIHEVETIGRLWHEGAIAPQSLYWREGMSEWRPITEFFEGTKSSEAIGPPPVLASASAEFVKDPSRQTRFLIGLLRAYAALSAVTGLITVSFLLAGHVPSNDPQNLSPTDLAGLLVGLPVLVVALLTAVVFLMWIHRANSNARALGAEGMTFSPGWSVGWYFIPILNLWKPYQAMKQIWQASANPMAWRAQSPPSVLPLWWGLWIASCAVSNLYLGFSLRAESRSDLVVGEIIELISTGFDIALCLVAIRLVREIIRWQTHWAARISSAESACAVCREPTPSAEMICLSGKWVCARCKPILVQQFREGAPGV